MSEEIIRITKDILRANELYIMAQERMKDIIPILPKDKSYKIIEEYYEVIVQLSTAIMYSKGYKTLSPVSLISLGLHGFILSSSACGKYIELYILKKVVFS